jgi:hypothetical protein
MPHCDMKLVAANARRNQTRRKIVQHTCRISVHDARSRFVPRNKRTEGQPPHHAGDFPEGHEVMPLADPFGTEAYARYDLRRRSTLITQARRNCRQVGWTVLRGFNSGAGTVHVNDHVALRAGISGSVVADSNGEFQFRQVLFLALSLRRESAEMSGSFSATTVCYFHDARCTEFICHITTDC